MPTEPEVLRAQERLGRSLARARASEDRELVSRVRDEGFQLVHLLNGVLRMGHMHSLDNRAFDAPVRDLARTLERLGLLLGPLTLICVEEQVYLNEVRVRSDERSGTRELQQELGRHGLGGLRVHRPPSEAELRRLVACCARKPPEDGAREALREALTAEGLDFVEALGPFRFRLGGESPAGSSRDPRQALLRAGLVVEDAWRDLGQGRLLNVLPARRAVAELLAAGLERLGLTVEPPGLAPQAAHALRVARLALLAGREIGLSEALLQDLGVAALLHDVGYSRDAEPGPEVGFDRHPSAAARMLLQQRGFHPSKVRRLRAVLGHHRPTDAGRRRRPALLARLLRLAEDYDNLVRRARLPPAVALGRMASASGSLYDAVLLQAFVNALGAFPPGSRVALQDGRSGVVVAAGRGPAAWAKPVVVIDRAADGGRLPRPERADLARSPLRLRDEPHPAPVPDVAGGHGPEDSPPDLELGEPEAVSHPLASSPSAPAPRRVAGDIVQGIPIRLMHDLHRERRSGRLIFDDGAQRRALLFVKGNVVAAASTLPEHRLPALLLRSDLTEVEVIEQTQAEALRRVQPLGQLLVEKGVLEREQLEMLLRAQARLVCSDVATWEDGRYHFEDDVAPGLEEDVSPGLSMPSLVHGAVRAIRDPDVVRFALGDLSRLVACRADAEEEARRLLGPAEEALLEQIDGRTPARLALGASGLPPEDGQRALLALLSLGLAEYQG